MKKRAVSLFLAVLMLLSMLSVASLAANSSQSTLQMHVMSEEDGVWTEDFVTGGGWWDVYDNWVAMFYLHHPNGTTTLVAPGDLTLPDFLEMEIIDQTGKCELSVVGLGNGCITYRENGMEYSIDLTGVLPHLGVYRDMPFGIENLVDRRDVTIGENNTVFYIALDPDYAARGSRMSAVTLREGEKNLSDVSDIVISADGSYATVTITDSQAEYGYFFGVDVVNDGGNGPCGNWGLSIRINNELPGLYYRYLNNNNNVWTVNEYAEDKLWCTPGDDHTLIFYFGSRTQVENGEAAPIPMEDLSFPDYLNAQKLSQRVNEPVPDGSLWIECERFTQQGEATDMIYERQGTQYTMKTYSELPDVGFYTEPQASKAAFIWDGNPFTMTEQERTIYLCPSDHSEIKLIGIERFYDQEMEDVFALVHSGNNGDAQGRYIAFTLKDGEALPREELGVRVNFEMKESGDRWRTRTRGVWTPLINGQPVLMYRYLEWDNETKSWYENEEEELRTSVIIETGHDSPVQFYYGTPDNHRKVDGTALTFPTTILSGYQREGLTWLKGIGFEESGEITYTDGTVSARMKVRIVRPDFGFYSSTVADKNTLLGEDVMVNRAGDRFYVITDGDRTITAVEAVVYRPEYGGEMNVIDQFDIQIAPDGSYAVVTVKADAQGKLPNGGDYRIDLRQPWGTRYLHFNLIRGDLPQLSVPTQLSWHRDYDWNARSDSDYEQRMGSMSFYTGELSQNHYRFEIYSDVNGCIRFVDESGWRFGERNHASYLSTIDFIYGELPSGTYRFRVKAEGDGINYRDSEWSELSQPWTYTAPAAQLAAPNAGDLMWSKSNGRWDEAKYCAAWPDTAQAGAGYYEVYWYYQDPDTGRLNHTGGTFDIHEGDKWEDGFFRAGFHDDIILEHGNVSYFFQVRVIPADITQYRISPWSGYSPALDTENVTGMVNDKLEGILSAGGNQGGSSGGLTVEQVQQALAADTADLRTAMAADQDISGGPSSGTLELIKQLEQSVVDNVEQKVEAKGNAPQQIQEIADDIEMVGATLNWADEHPESGRTPDVTLVIEQPKQGIVIPEQRHNAVQFSMKLHGAIDADDEKDGQQLIVPIVIDMPVPASINPWFLVVLHKLDDGRIEQLWPNIYWDEAEQQHRATFVIDSFSDFALVEYDFRFDVDSVNKTTGEAPFVIAAVGSAAGSRVTYSSSNPDVAAVDAVTGQVTIKGEGTVIITATASATDLYPETTASYTLVVTRCTHAGGAAKWIQTSYSHRQVYTCCQAEIMAEASHRWSGAGGNVCAVCGYELMIQEGLETTPMYRLYNPNSGEHFYTGSVQERDNLVAAGWHYEGIAWNAPTQTGAPVHRLYNPNSGDHHYTMSTDERNVLVSVGWIYEGVCWNSASNDALPLFRLYNPNADCGSHHYTGSVEERAMLVEAGWHYEGIGWFGTLR